MPDPVLLAEHVTYAYPGAGEASLVDVSLSIGQGEFVVLAGASGSGKSTLLRCFLGLIPHLYGGEISGRVQTLGEDTAQTPPHRLAPRVGMVFQSPEDQLVATLVVDDVAFGPENLGLPRADVSRRVENALASTGTTDLRDRSIQDLSAGQQQRVALAGIVAMEPAVLLLDEPTSQLDPRAAGELVGLLHHLSRETGLTVVVAEHRLELALPIADRLIVLAGGRIQRDGPPRSVIAADGLAEMGIGVPRVVQLFADLDGLFPGHPTVLSVEEGADLVIRRAECRL